MTRYLIVNGDDFGASDGINRGIVDAYEHGLLTSTSLMVNMPAATAAAALGRARPDLSVGLHVNLTDEDDYVVRWGTAHEWRASLDTQMARFCELMGRPPTHLDAHHHVHRDPRLRPLFVALAEAHGLPLREHCAVRHYPSFYGQWDGVTHLEQVSPQFLIAVLQDVLTDGVTELGCHPGYVDDAFASSYHLEREAELRTLCDPSVRRAATAADVRLISFHALANPRETIGGSGPC